MGAIDFNKVFNYSLKNCSQTSNSKCATFVKRAFEQGGCKYVDGNGCNNQPFLQQNGFKLISRFNPRDDEPRKHGNPVQFPSGYTQQPGDVCLIHCKDTVNHPYGHICYAIGPGINDWVSDFFQRQPGQKDNTGPYCYADGTKIDWVEFWRHPSYDEYVENNDVIDENTIAEYAQSAPIKNNATTSSQRTVASNNVSGLCNASSTYRKNYYSSSGDRKKDFETLQNSLGVDDSRKTKELYNSNILKHDQTTQPNIEFV